MENLLKGVEVKNITDNQADLFFYGDIVSDWWGAWQEEDQYPDAIKNFLSNAEGKDLNVYINSGGGSVFAGIAIYNMLKRHAAKNRVTVHVDGLAGSIASILAFAGSEPPEIPSNAFLMIHKPWAGVSGNADDMRKMANDLDNIQTGILNAYENHLKEGVSIEEIKSLMDAETWLNGQQAAEYFDIKTTEAKEYAAAVGNFIYDASCRNIPEEIRRTKEAQAAAYQEEIKKSAERAKISKQNEIKRLVIAGMAKGE
jgi:ATP-dependent Clp endopeptidase proteolytic subunit ClpP